MFIKITIQLKANEASSVCNEANCGMCSGTWNRLNIKKNKEISQVNLKTQSEGTYLYKNEKRGYFERSPCEKSP